jgi:MFS family permease
MDTPRVSEQEEHRVLADALADTSRARGTARLRRLLRALQVRNYRLYVAGQSVSLLGTWMQRLALSWWVYQRTHSALVLGLVGGVGQLPALLLAPLAGALVDRWDRQRLLVVTQLLAMLQAVGLAWLVLAESATLWHVLLCSVLLGMINAVDMPARQALVGELVEQPADLSNALALNASITNGARLIGPALAGLVIVRLGEGICFLLNGLSYLALLAAVWAMRLPPHPTAPPRTPLLAEAHAGVRYAWGFTPVRAILLLLTVANLLGMPYQVLLPVFATDMLHGDAHTLARLTAASGVGAILGALYLASRDRVVGFGRVLVLSTSLFGLGLVGLSYASHEGVAWLTLIAASGGMMVLSTASNTTLQTIVEEEKRGRILSLYSMVFMGTAPVGSLVAGTVATHLTAPHMVRIGGLCCLAGALVFARHLPTLRAMVRPLSAHREILQDTMVREPTAMEVSLHAHHEH